MAKPPPAAPLAEYEPYPGETEEEFLAIYGDAVRAALAALVEPLREESAIIGAAALVGNPVLCRVACEDWGQAPPETWEFREKCHESCEAIVYNQDYDEL